MTAHASEKPHASAIRIKDVAAWVRRVYAAEFHTVSSHDKRDWIMEFAGRHGLSFDNRKVGDAGAFLIQTRAALASMPEAKRYAMMDLVMMVDATLNTAAAFNPATAQLVRDLPPLEWKDLSASPVAQSQTVH
ncbi:MAG: hypothetical protein EOP24_41165 [Hyphomicrobiales bacterium]|nr:MAG: hypothetical protein EOP24_41165 [Hyphomicrobiales bacterium]